MLRISEFLNGTYRGKDAILVSEFPPVSPVDGTLWYNNTDKLLYMWSENIWKYVQVSQTVVYPSENGETSYTQPGTYQWVCPEGVNWVHVVCVGGGGGSSVGNGGGGGGGGGGGLAWRNDIAVVPGESYAVVVGAGGQGNTSFPQRNGGDSYFIDPLVVVAYGGMGNNYDNAPAGGGFFPFGGSGGSGGSRDGSLDYAGGGGGAGGYSGIGGNGASVAGSPSNGDGGAGGGGFKSGLKGTAGGGGGVGIFGQGMSGSAAESVSGTRGGGGSGGEGGGIVITGGLYGGGGGSTDTNTSGNGGNGAVRIIWGPNRAFPSTNTGLL